MHSKEKMREGEKREAGVVGGRLEIQNSPAAMADGSSSCAAAWRRLARVFGARLKRRRWGLSRGARGGGLIRFLLGFGGIRGEHGIGRERKERKKERGRGAGRGRRWAGCEMLLGRSWVWLLVRLAGSGLSLLFF